MISDFVCFVTYAHKSPLVCAASVFRGFTLWKIHFFFTKARFSGPRFVYDVLFYAANIFLHFNCVCSFQRTQQNISLVFCWVHKIWGRALNKSWENQPSIHLTIILFTFYLLLLSRCWGSARASPWSRGAKAGFHCGLVQENDPLPKESWEIDLNKNKSRKRKCLAIVKFSYWS